MVDHVQQPAGQPGRAERLLQEGIGAQVQAFLLHVEPGGHDHTHTGRLRILTDRLQDLHATLVAQMNIHEDRIGLFAVHCRRDVGVHIQCHHLKTLHFQEGLQQRNHGCVIFREEYLCHFPLFSLTQLSWFYCWSLPVMFFLLPPGRIL